MYETLDSSNGIGLAAPQIGLPIRLVVIDLDVLSEDFPEYKGFRHAFINAHILENFIGQFIILLYQPETGKARVNAERN